MRRELRSLGHEAPVATGVSARRLLSVTLSAWNDAERDGNCTIGA
jgi:hypothetical protein